MNQVQLSDTVLLFHPIANPKRWRLPLLKADGPKGHAGQPEYATQEKAQEIRDRYEQGQREGGGKE